VVETFEATSDKEGRVAERAYPSKLLIATTKMMTRTIYTLIQIAVAGCYDRRNERIEEEIRRKANGEVAVNFESKLADTRGRATKTDRSKVEGRQRPPNVAEGLPILPPIQSSPPSTS
jgi:hypothetical protein